MFSRILSILKQVQDFVEKDLLRLVCTIIAIIFFLTLLTPRGERDTILSVVYGTFYLILVCICGVYMLHLHRRLRFLLKTRRQK